MSQPLDIRFLKGIADALASRFETAAFVVKVEAKKSTVLASGGTEPIWPEEASAILASKNAETAVPLDPLLNVGVPSVGFVLIPGEERVFLSVIATEGGPPLGARLHLLAQFAGVVAKRLGVTHAPKAVEPTAALETKSAQNTSASLQSRYQKLLLLNRIAIGLFSGPSLEESLESAAHGILALSGGKYLVLYRRGESGSLDPIFYLGDRRFSDEQATVGLNDVLMRLRLDPSPAWSPPPPVGWFALPIAARGSRRLDGVLAVGFLNPEPPTSNVQTLLNDVGRMLHNAFRAERQLREQETLAAVTEQSADPILMTDLEGRITAWSRGAEETFGFSAQEVLNQDMSSLLVPPGEEEEAKRIEQEARDNGSVLAAECKRLRRDGTVIDIEATYTVIKDDAGRPFGTVRILRDITRRKEIERMREEFIALVTHDLRIPLTSIRGFSDTMVEYWKDLPDEEKIKYTKVILRESKRMGRLVDDFLDLSKLESGTPDDLVRTFTSIPSMLQSVIDTLKGYGPKINFNFEAAESLQKIPIDPDQIERVLINLGGNAIKYSRDGNSVSFSAVSTESGIEFSVSDEGPGIPEEDQKHLFDKFYRVSDDISKKKRGTGLGLTVCKYIVEAHGGRIWVESQLGKGSSFKFHLPNETPETSK